MPAGRREKITLGESVELRPNLICTIIVEGLQNADRGLSQQPSPEQFMTIFGKCGHFLRFRVINCPQNRT
jgi:hypothetical protein